jgi:hypothetical protein
VVIRSNLTCVPEGRQGSQDRQCQHAHLRHTFRAWLDSVGTPVGVQQRLMRHADIRTTMNVFRDAVTQDMADAHGKVVRLAIPLNGSPSGSQSLQVAEKMVSAEGICKRT